jgi:hypothetical protein
MSSKKLRNGKIRDVDQRNVSSKKNCKKISDNFDLTECDKGDNKLHLLNIF